MIAPALPRRLIARETAISTVINGLMSLAFFLLIFGRQGPVAVWGPGNLALDNVVQAFMIALMSTLVPGALLRRRLGLKGGRELLVRAAITAVIASILAAGLAALVFAGGEIDALPWAGALRFKLALGASVAAIVTPIGLTAIARVPR